MLADSLTLAFTSGDRVLVKIRDDSAQTVYRLRGSLYETVLRIRHSVTKAGRERHNMELTEYEYATETEAESDRKVYCVFEAEPRDTADDHIKVLGTLMTTAALVAQILNGES